MNFTAGAIAGISSIALAIPVLAQISSAASTGTTASASTAAKTRPAPTVACVQALAAKDDAFLSNVDTMIAAQKTATTTHRNALTAAAAITDDTQRQAAVKAADEAFRTAMKTAMDSQMTTGKTEMEALKTACGDTMGGMRFEMAFGGPMGGHGKGGMMRGPNPEELAQKLGITADELKTELDSGKSIEDIAAAHGVTLPARAEGKNFIMRFQKEKASQTSSIQ